MASIFQKRRHGDAGHLLLTLQGDEFDEEDGFYDDTAEFGDEFAGRSGGVAGGKEVVDEGDAFDGEDGVVVYLDDIIAVFQGVGMAAAAVSLSLRTFGGHIQEHTIALFSQS